MNVVFAAAVHLAGLVIALQGERGPIAARLVRRAFPNLPLVLVGGEDAVGGPTAWVEPGIAAVRAAMVAFDAQRIVGAHDVHAVVQRLAAQVAADRCVFAQWVDLRCVVVAEHGRLLGGSLGRALTPAFGPGLARVLDHGEVVVLADVAELPPEEGLAYRLARVGAVLCVPVCSDQLVIGCLAAQQQQPRRWRPEEEELLVAVAARLAPNIRT